MATKRTEELIRWDREHLIHPAAPIGQEVCVIWEKAHGIMIEDTEGREYIDVSSQLINANLGHGRKEIIGAAIEVHKVLGPGLLESAYEECLCRELILKNLFYQRQVPVPVDYKGVRLECGYQLDVLVENKVVIEIKSLENLMPVHKKQLLTYLRLLDKRLGLLINFNVPVLKNGVKRVVNNL